jgi:RNA polymerase sigma-70 factor (sigma-E family)
MTTGRRRAAGSREDELLSRLYQQVAEQQEARFAAGYDMAAGLDRYRAWLREHTTEERARPQAIPVAGPAALLAGVADSGAGVAAVGGPAVPRETTQEPAGSSGTPAAEAGHSADRAVVELYRAHYRSLVRLAAMLVRDTVTAEEIVQDSFVALHGGWPRLRDYEKALSYLRQAVVNRSRSVLRQPETADNPAPDLPSAEHGALTLLDRPAVAAALRALPERQREALVLRYYADLSEEQIAAAMGLSQGAVKSHTVRAMASLRAVLEME